MQNTNKNALERDTLWRARGFRTEAERHHHPKQNLPASTQKQA